MSAKKPEPGELWCWHKDEESEATSIFLVLEFKGRTTWNGYTCKILTLAGRVGVFAFDIGTGKDCCSLVSEVVKEEVP